MAVLITEIGQFQFATLADEQILRLQVPVQYLAFVNVRQSAQQLEREEAHVVGRQTARMAFQILSQIRMLNMHHTYMMA